MLRGLGAAAGFTFAAAALFAQTPSPTPSPAPAAATTPAPSPSTSEAPPLTPSATAAGESPPETPPITPNAAPTDTRALIDEIGGCVERGKLNVEVDLLEGSVPVVQKWTVVTKGSPLAKLSAQAASGRIERLNFDVSNGTLLVAGRGLRPKVYVESVAFEDGKGITDAKFHGKGIWRPIVAIFRGIAMSALKKLQFQTDIPSVLRGDVLGSSSAKPGKEKAPTPVPTPAVAGEPTPTPGPSFLDLVREARIHDSEFVAYGGKPLGMGELIRFQTAAAPKAGVPLKLTLAQGSYVPGRDGAPARIDASGALEGEIENGAVGFGESHSTFSSGELRGGKFHIRTLESGKFGAQIGASSFSVELTSGEFHLPGGTEVDAAAPSRIGFRDLKVEEDGSYSAVLDADLTGKVGRIARAGTTVSLASVHARTTGTRVVNMKVTGDLDLEFDYKLDYMLSVHYPMKEVGEKKVLLTFHGPFKTRVHYENASKDSGTVTGDYAFKAPWPPIEQAALEVLKARWSQDVTPALRRVNFDIEPRRFSPCGENCFLLEVGVTAEKKSGKTSLLRQKCEPQGKADLVIDSPSRSFQLKNIKLTTRCKGVVGWFLNLITPLLTKTYNDMTLFKMPEDLPFTIEKVGAGANWVAISGKIDYQGNARPASAASSGR